MPFCTQCAHPIPEGGRFCPQCGAPSAAEAPRASASIAATVSSGPPTPPPPSSWDGRFEPGTRLGERYRIVALLGRGGMGEVYRADDLQLGQSVALKFLPAGLAANAAELAQFRNEVRTARLIAHPNVCRVYDIGEAGSHVFLSMEYIDGEDLASVLRRMGRLTSDKAVEIARQICHGLAAAHEAGLLHRDLKPANVMIDGRGRARITDFGLAGLAEELGRDGQPAGTPAYMAPEQIAHGRVTVRSDIYSLGLVLYELFTGKRVFDVRSLAELKQMQESGSITTPSDFARDIDPAVERVIMHCLERDADARPPSAYAVLGALPGGDALAAALAAGETPSPELVANSGDRGTLHPPIALAWVAAGLVGIGLWTGVIGPEFRPLTRSTQWLSVRADDVLSKTGAFEALPTHTAEGFDIDRPYLVFRRSHPTAGGTKRTPVFFWRRWSPRPIASADVHREIARVDDPPLLAAGEAAVLFDPAGRLIGLRALPPDSVPARPGRVPWEPLWSATGLDAATFTPTPVMRPMPAMCDTAAAWTGPLPWSNGEQVTIRAGASRGRLVYATMIRPWGPTTAPVDSLGADPIVSYGWGSLLFFILPVLASIYFGSRNLWLGRGDWRGATRIAGFVFVMNLLEGLFATRLAEDGLIGAGFDLFTGQTFAHSTMHAVEMWFAYMALEPYVRRLWPRILVSWARVISGRWRDPLVGRDLLLGTMAGSLIGGIGLGSGALAARLGLTQVPTQLTTEGLQSLTSLGNTACALAYCGSICVLSALDSLVMVLVIRLIFRQTWIAVALTYLVIASFSAAGLSPDYGWPIAVLNGIVAAITVLVLMRFGLLPAVVALFVQLVVTWAVGSLDWSSWYADRALVPVLLLVVLLAYGAATALAGKPILGDPLRESPRA